MRPDQAARLAEIGELLVEAFLLEADPRQWPGDGKQPTDLSVQERGDRLWTKKNAIGSAAVLRCVHDLADRDADATAGAPRGDEGDLDRDIRRYEGQAAKLLARVQGVSGSR